MPQGKFKPTKKPVDNAKAKKKGKAFTTRSRAPIQPKKAKFAEAQKLKQIITKTVNRSAEEDIRGRAREGTLNLSKAQLAVAKHHKDQHDRKPEVAVSTETTS